MGPALVSAEETSRLVKNLKAVLRCLPIRLLVGIPRGLLGIPL